MSYVRKLKARKLQAQAHLNALNVAIELSQKFDGCDFNEITCKEIYSDERISKNIPHSCCNDGEVSINVVLNDDDFSQDFNGLRWISLVDGKISHKETVEFWTGYDDNDLETLQAIIDEVDQILENSERLMEIEKQISKLQSEADKLMNHLSL